MLLCFGLLFSLTFGEQWVQHKGTLYAIDSCNGGTYDDDRYQNANDMMWWMETIAYYGPWGKKSPS